MATPTKIDATQLNLGPGLYADQITGQLRIDLAKLISDLGLGQLAKMNTVPVENGGTGASVASAARKNLALGTAATFDIGTAPGNVPVYDDDNALPAEKFLAGGTTIVDSNGINIGGECIVKAKGSQVLPVSGLSEYPMLNSVYVGDENGTGALYITDTTVDPANISQLNNLAVHLNSLISQYNKLIDQLKNHHGLIS